MAITLDGTNGITAPDIDVTAQSSDIVTSGDLTAAGIYLGGTGAANKLEDYEEGTYQATLTPDFGSFTMDTARDTLQYVKIGSLVHITGYIRVSSVSSATGALTLNLPFTSKSGAEFSSYSYATAVPENLASGNSNEFNIAVTPSNSNAYIYYTAGGGAAASWFTVGQKFQVNTNVRLNFSYHTDS
jgi:hypothetical protein